MSGYRWRGDTDSAEAARAAADAAWEYTQRVNAQRKRQDRAAPEAASPAAGAPRSWQAQAIAARIRRPASEGDTP